MSKLPDGWTKTKLDNICQWGSGGTPSRKNSEYYGGDIHWLKTGELGKKLVFYTEEKITHLGLINSSAKLFPKGSVAIAMYGATIGKTSILGVDATTNQACAVGSPFDGITTSEYLYYFLSSQKELFIEAGKGGAQPNISQSVIKDWPIRLAPLNEQKRIADKLDAVLARVDACRDRLDRIPAIIKRFRQSVLDAAISGVLTEDWRLSNPLHDGKAIDDLCARELGRSGALRVRGEAARVEEQFIFELPSSWAWVANHRLAVDDSNAICAGPFGTIFKAKDFREFGVPIIFLRHVGEGRYLTHKPGFMEISVWEKLHKPYTIIGGELLVTKLGDPPGTACIYPNGIGYAMVTPDVMKMSVDSSVAQTEYLMYFFNSPSSKKITESLCFGVTRLRIDLSMFKTFPIPLPPIEEQREIVRRVGSLFAYADRLEARYQAARAQVEKLTPAILAKAFRGELVPQDPNDEPASELLARIAAARSSDHSPKARKSSRGKTSRSSLTDL